MAAPNTHTADAIPTGTHGNRTDATMNMNGTTDTRINPPTTARKDTSRRPFVPFVVAPITNGTTCHTQRS